MRGREASHMGADNVMHDHLPCAAIAGLFCRASLCARAARAWGGAGGARAQVKWPQGWVLGRVSLSPGCLQSPNASCTHTACAAAHLPSLLSPAQRSGGAHRQLVHALAHHGHRPAGEGMCREAGGLACHTAEIGSCGMSPTHQHQRMQWLHMMQFAGRGETREGARTSGVVPHPVF